jgi:hypothetical protein
VLPNNQVRIESYYAADDPAVEGIVRVYRPDGQLLCPPGVLNEKGQFVFWYPLPEELKVTVTHDGHKAKEMTISAAELQDPNHTAAADEGESFSWSAGHAVLGLIAGLGFILGLAAFVLSVWNTIRLQSLQSRPPVTPAPVVEPLPTALRAAPNDRITP